MTLFEVIVGYVIGLAANATTNANQTRREKALTEALKDRDKMRRALAAVRSIRKEVGLACIELAKSRHRLGVTADEEPLWRLLDDESFQNDLTEWFAAGGIEEGESVRSRLIDRMKEALRKGGATEERISFLETQYFEAIDRAVFSDQLLAHWRHQLSLNYLREQVAFLREKAEEAAGIYAPERQRAALDRYCEKALAHWDIIDLSNLPEGDIEIATQALLLRTLYMPLRLNVETRREQSGDDSALAELEERRLAGRFREAGRGRLPELERKEPKERASVGERLGSARRLVVLGDPGSGKTTMMRWMATAYLLRYGRDEAFRQIPDADTLPTAGWIPVLIRCRDLGDADLCRSFPDFLAQHLQKTDLLPQEADVMNAVILNAIATGQVLLLVDGLDEITDPRVRVMFCQELERTATRYPDAPIVVTSRIVGYRDMPYRMGKEFEHGVIADLTPEDKDDFAERWIGVTDRHQSGEEKKKRIRELREALHSSDRIERLSGNPMLLTTLALVKRKVGKLPSKRAKLYKEAVSVLLNWNPQLYRIIEEDEAIPQLECVAYEMCRQGVQNLMEDELLEVLYKFREDYPKIRAIRKREPHEFLELLEARSSILIKSGGRWEKQQEKAVWEFRHLTFQEYLAAQALLDGRYLGRDTSKTLAEQVAPLAGSVQEVDQWSPVSREKQVVESWQEALRLLVADCKDDDVDEVLDAIATPLPTEDPEETARPRAVLAARCLADEPNVSDEMAKMILEGLAKQVSRGDGATATTLDQAALEVRGSIWGPMLKTSLVREFLRRDPSTRGNPGDLMGTVELLTARPDEEEYEVWFQGLAAKVASEDEIEATGAALTVMAAAYLGRALLVPGLIDALFTLVPIGGAQCHVAAEALGLLSTEKQHWPMDSVPIWQPKGEQVEWLLVALETAAPDESPTRRHMVRILASSKDPRSLERLIRTLDDGDKGVRREVAEVLGEFGDLRAVAPLIRKLDDPELNVRRAVAEALGKLGDRRAVAPLIVKLDDPDEHVRRVVAEALGELGDCQAVEPLIVKLDDPDEDVWAVAEALGKLGDRQAVEPLIVKIEDPDEGVRKSVVEALAKLGDRRAVKPLIPMLENEWEDSTATIDLTDLYHWKSVQVAVVEALGKLGDKRAVEPLIVKLDAPDEDVRKSVVEALAKLGDRRAVKPLIRMIENKWEDNTATIDLTALVDHWKSVQVAVVEALGKLGDKQAGEPLIGMLDAPDWRVRHVAEALGKLGDMRAVEPLIGKLDHPDEDVREAVAEALAKLGETIDANQAR